MEKIFTVGKSDDNIIKELGFDFVEMPLISTDEELNDFIENKLSKIEFKALILPLYKENATIMLRLGLHIRLTESLWQKRLSTLLFVSTETLATIIRDSGIYGHILVTKGCKFEKIISIEMIKKVINSIDPLLIDDFKSKFLSIINIQPDEKVGRHSLANQWGALALDKAANVKAIQNNEVLQKAQKQLYFKYITALNFNYNSLKSPKKQPIDVPQLGKMDKINALNKRILLIDDEADKGWNDVLKAIFKGADFQSIDFKNKTFKYKKESIKKVKEEDWDLILLDLRLNPSEEDTGDKLIKTEDYSGARILKKIKKYNKGIQVIMLTASNKAWNMKKLLDLGADGYYIKESPEFNFSPEFTSESFDNFAKECNSCFEKYYLRKIFKIDKAIQKKLDLENGILGNHTLGRGTVNLIKAYLKQAFNAIYEYSQTQKEYALYSFLEYYKIVELLGKELIIDNPTKFFVKRRSDIDFIIKSPLLSKIEPVKEFSNTGKYFIKGYKKNDYIPITDDEGFYKKPTSSLRFSGLMLLRLGFDETSVENFMLLNNLRNTVVAHSADNSTTEIKVENVIALLEILEKTFQKL